MDQTTSIQDGKKQKKKKKNGGIPAMEYRPVFVQFLGVRRCRYNPSFVGFQRLPAFLKTDIISKRTEKHGDALPPLEISYKKRQLKG